MFSSEKLVVNIIVTFIKLSFKSFQEMTVYSLSLYQTKIKKATEFSTENGLHAFLFQTIN